MPYPYVDHRDPDRPQPEFCELCGERWPGDDMVRSEVEGLRGILVCGNPTTGCAQFRSRMTFRDRRRMWRPSAYVGSGKHSVFDGGDINWADEDENTNITNPV